ncbi:MAG TPA: VWA domain-containing protein [Acidimicrobiia bacterium]|nr:VWA domain-containing protein [Acidimicrobiia bacterium]
MKKVAIVLALVVLASCSFHDPEREPRHVADPGRCTPVDIAVAPETFSVVDSLARAFNGSAAAKLRGGCAFVRTLNMESATAMNRLAQGWPNAHFDGPAPTAWIPASTAWGMLLDSLHGSARATTGTSLATVPTVVAVAAPDLHLLPSNPTWNDVARLRLGKANPYFSTSALLATLAVRDATTTKAVEQSVVYYGASSTAFLANWLHVQTEGGAPSDATAVIADARAVRAYNLGSARGLLPVHGKKHPKDALVPLTPVGGIPDADNPILVLDAPWSSAVARAGAQAFTTFVTTATARQKFTKAGFGPPRNSTFTEADLLQALDQWSRLRRPARVRLLVDVSDSMGDIPSRAFSVSKLALTRTALLHALDTPGLFGADDQVGLRIFATKLPGGADWRDVVPMAPYPQVKANLIGAINGLATAAGSPLYAAAQDTFETAQHTSEPGAINAVVLLTDGYNEVSGPPSRSQLLTLVAKTPRVRVFTIALGSGADTDTLRRMSQDSDAVFYDASAAASLPDAVAAALANF